MDRRTTRVRRAAAVALVVGLGLTGCADDKGAGAAATEGRSDTKFVSGSGTVTRIEPGDRGPAGKLAGPSLDGDRLDLASYRGKVVVLNVWGSWCAPCRKEAPELVAAAKVLQPRGVEFVGVNSRDNDPGPAKAFVRRFKLTYPSIYDPTGEQLLGFRESLPPSAIPSTLVIDTKGRVAARVIGETTRRTLEGLAADVLAEK